MAGAPLPPPPFPEPRLSLNDSKLAEFVNSPVGQGEENKDEDSIDLQKEIYDTTAVDPILTKKMALVNSALDEIGMTPFQWKLFALNGFGYAVDSVSRCLSLPLFLALFPGFSH